MKKLTPKGIISLSTTAFLFFVLMSIIYLNNQVEFNPIEAKWELQDNLTIGQEYEIIVGTTTAITFIDYQVSYLENYRINFDSTGNLVFDDGNDFDYYSIDKTEIINDSLFIDDLTQTVIIAFYDSNQTYISYYTNDSVTNSYWTSRPKHAGKFSDIYDNNSNEVTIPVNAEYFAMTGAAEYRVNDILPRITYQEFQDINNQYEGTAIVNLTDTAILNSYEVFENIRNNSTTINPLGFMNTLVSIPSQAVGYFKSFTEFLSFDIQEGITTWWTDKLLGSESGYWSLVEFIQGLGD